MRLRFERDIARLVTIGSVEGRPEAVREFDDRELWPSSYLIKAWIEELKEYLGEDVEQVWQG
jgi:hypothetical protein